MTNDIIIDNEDLNKSEELAKKEAKSIIADEIIKSNAKAAVEKAKATKATITQAQKKKIEDEAIKKYLAAEKKKVKDEANKLEKERLDKIKNFNPDNGQMLEIQVEGSFRESDKGFRIPYEVTIKVPNLLNKGFLLSHVKARYLKNAVEKKYCGKGVGSIVGGEIISERLLSESIPFAGKMVKDLTRKDFQDIATYFNISDIGIPSSPKTKKVNTKFFLEYYYTKFLKRGLKPILRMNNILRKEMPNYALLDTLVISISAEDNNADDIDYLSDKRVFNKEGFEII